VLKRTAADVLVSAVKFAARGEIYVDPAVAPAAPGAAPAFKPPSGRELEVLVLYCRGRTTKEIAAEIGVGTRTVETYLARVREKLGTRSRADLVRYAAAAGLLDVG
jgi:DNA-binding NarL/FixJ family response regulator